MCISLTLCMIDVYIIVDMAIKKDNVERSN